MGIVLVVISIPVYELKPPRARAGGAGADRNRGGVGAPVSKSIHTLNRLPLPSYAKTDDIRVGENFLLYPVSTFWSTYISSSHAIDAYK